MEHVRAAYEALGTGDVEPRSGSCTRTWNGVAAAGDRASGVPLPPDAAGRGPEVLESAIRWREVAGDADFRLDDVVAKGEDRVTVLFSWSDAAGRRTAWRKPFAFGTM